MRVESGTHDDAALVFRATGGMRSATALADTFGTEAFVAAAVATSVPPEFVADIADCPAQGFPAVSIDLPPGVMLVRLTLELPRESVQNVAESPKVDVCLHKGSA